MRFTIIIILITCISCGGNRMKVNEKSLATEILTEEVRIKQEREAKEKQLADSLAKLPKGFRFKEIREVDPSRPPAVIDIIGNRTNPTEKLKLSMIFDKIEYIIIKQSPDSINGRPIITPNHIYILDHTKGIAQFDRQGNFIKYICNNFRPHTKLEGGAIMINTEQYNQSYGAADVYWNGDKLYYKYDDRPEGKTYIMSFDENSQSVQMPDLEGDNNKLRLGNVVSAPLKEIRNGKLISGNIIASAQGPKTVRERDLFTVMSVSGDTICTFKDFDPVRNYTRSVSRGVDSGDSYMLNDIYYIRQCFNDTVYEFTPPNRFTPRYILNFGDKGIKSANEGIDVSVGLGDKLVGPTLLESNKHLFITYTKDYSCPATAKSGSLKYSRLIYDKNSRSIITVYIDKSPDYKGVGWPRAPHPEIENDLDGMPFIWPTILTPEGNPFVQISAEELPPVENRPEVLKNVGENDKIIIIYN